ncbi:MAG: hypothetical protein L6262_02125 [Weeksellaceae bacterium]|nr:hypothetical protein [Weeksellaceae bacterium]
MQNKSNITVGVLFFATFIVHFCLWKFLFYLDEVILIKFYLFLSIIFMMMMTLILLIHKRVPQFLGVSVLGLVLIKFVLMYLIKNKLHFEEIPGYKYHFILPYFVLTALITYYAIQLINYDKKQ